MTLVDCNAEIAFLFHPTALTVSIGAQVAV
jgi:hypothetical protein